MEAIILLLSHSLYAHVKIWIYLCFYRSFVLPYSYSDLLKQKGTLNLESTFSYHIKNDFTSLQEPAEQELE